MNNNKKKPKWNHRRGCEDAMQRRAPDETDGGKETQTPETFY